MKRKEAERHCTIIVCAWRMSHLLCKTEFTNLVLCSVGKGLGLILVCFRGRGFSRGG